MRQSHIDRSRDEYDLGRGLTSRIAAAISIPVRPGIEYREMPHLVDER